MSVRFLVIIIVLVTWSCTRKPARQIIDFTSSWRFLQNDDTTAFGTNYDDSDWRILDLPHDWSIEGKFSESNPAGPHGGGLPTGTAWYRKTFSLPHFFGNKRIYIDFDGVYRNSEVWINGQYLGKRPNGYISFRYDLTPFIVTGKEKNVLAVRVDNSDQPNSRWYTGSGIYRNVRLVVTGQVHTVHRGIFITTPEITEDSARISLDIKLCKHLQEPAGIWIKTVIRDKDDNEIAVQQTSNMLISDSITELNQEFMIEKPVLWSVDNPYLYKAVICIHTGKKPTDIYETGFGIRYFSFEAKQGFFLNGEPLGIQGVCNHHDLGALGAAVNIRAIERQLEMLKEMGCNAIRTAHNPPAPDLLDLCDRMGFLVIDEAFDVWSRRKVIKDYHKDWEEWHARDLTDMILRDRNHPSVIMWSIGNEIPEQFDSTGIFMTRELVEIVKNLDSTRPVTCALTETDPQKNFIYQSHALDVLGFNYKHSQWSELPERFPGEKIVAVENMSALATRGYYEMPSDSIRRWPEAHEAPLKGANAYSMVSSYDHVSAYWGSTHEETLREFYRNDFLAGVFVWTGYDYLGEPVPYTWPARSSYFGVVDLAGFQKDAYFLYQSIWTDKPVLHLFPHWNWKPDQIIDIWAYYNNADEVELFMNGKSLGIKSKKEDEFHVMWRVKYKPGSIKAVSRKDGRTILEKEIETADKPAKIELVADRKVIKSDGKDLSFVTAKIVDKNGVMIPDADNLINFKIGGMGKIVATDNGYQASQVPFRTNTRKAFNGKCLVIIQSTTSKGVMTLNAESEDLLSAKISIRSR
jgi:beta-galactosidase